MRSIFKKSVLFEKMNLKFEIYIFENLKIDLKFEIHAFPKDGKKNS